MNDSIQAFCHGLPGSINRVCAPLNRHRSAIAERSAFIIWITEGSGEATIARFSQAHHIAWQTALVLLALSEVIVRIGIITVRSLHAANTTTPSTAQSAPQPV